MEYNEGFGPSSEPTADAWGNSSQSWNTASQAAPDAISDAEALDALKVLEERRKQRRKQRFIKGGAAAVAAAVVIGAVFFFTHQNSDASEDVDPIIETEVVERGDFFIPVSGNGTLKAAVSAAVTPEVEGTVTEVFVEEGQHVEKGDRLFTMESPEIESAIKEAGEKVNEADRAIAKADAAVSAAQSKYNKANKAYKSAKSKSDKAKKKYQDAKKKADAKKAEADADGKKAYDKAYNAEIKKAADPDKPTADEKAAAEKVAQAAYDEAYKKVKIPKVPSYDAEKYAEALASASDARDAAQSDLEGAKEDLASAESDAVSAREDYAEAEAEREKCTVTAPESGTLVSFDVEVGSSTGSSEGSGDAIARVSDLSRMKVSIEVNENEIAKIEKGQTASIVPTAFSDVELEGTVVNIASSATGDDDMGGFDGSSVTFKVDLEIAEPDAKLKPGMSVSVQIHTQEKKNVLIVPVSALSEEDDGTYVQVVTNEETMESEQKKVSVVVQDSNRAVVKKGVKEGDIVIVSQVDFASEFDEEYGDGAAADDMEAEDYDMEAEDFELEDESDLDFESDFEE